MADALADPQVLAMGTVCETEHTSEGVVKSIHCPILVDGKRPRAEILVAPTLGEHTIELLARHPASSRP